MYVCMYVTAVLKAVSLPGGGGGGHTVELPSTSSYTGMGIKQSSSLTLDYM